MHKELFSTHKPNAPIADTTNRAGGKAYQLDAHHGLAKIACVGTLNDTYNCSAKDQLTKVLELCSNADSEFIAKLAVYSRRHACLKDMPAILTAYLARHHVNVCKQIFNRAINNPKMLRNFVQLLRSGTIAPSRSLGTVSRNLVRDYLGKLTEEQLFRADVGNNPSLPDIIKMVHPKPASKEREASYRYLLGKAPKQEEDKKHLLPLAVQFEEFKQDMSKDIPNVPFQMLTSLPLKPQHWKAIAANATFEQMRQNLNTFDRHGVFVDEVLTKLIANKLSDPEQVRGSRVFPYQLFTTLNHVNETVPTEIKTALQSALEVALENVPVLDGKFYVALDTSGSMGKRVTGSNVKDKRTQTKARYIDIAALFASALVRKNKQGVILPFDTDVRLNEANINPFDSLMTNTQKLAAIRGGGTDVSAALRWLNAQKATGSLVVVISDNESWRAYKSKATGMMEEWSVFAKRNPGSYLVNIDISPSDTTQVAHIKNTLLVGGFNDQVFDVIAGYLRSGGESEYWVNLINEIKL